MVSKDKRDFAKWWIWILLLIFITGIATFGLRYFGVVGERIIFENSFQKSSSENAKLSALKAELVGIDSRLKGTLTPTQREDLEAQRRAVVFQINKTENEQ